MIEKWWVVLYIVSKAVSVCINIAKDGEPRKGEYSAPAAIIAGAIIFTLAYFGGLFRCL